VRFALRSLAALALVFIGPLGCEPALVVNERFLPTTVGIVTSNEEFQADGQPHYRYLLADGRLIEVAAMDLDPFSDPVPQGDLLLMGDGPPPWIIRAAGTEGAQSECFGTGLRAVDRGATVEMPGPATTSLRRWRRTTPGTGRPCPPSATLLSSACRARTRRRAHPPDTGGGHQAVEGPGIRPETRGSRQSRARASRW
jgi:hypothetical protein